MMVALGFNLIFGTVKFFDIGYGVLTAVGGYAVFFFYKKLGLDLSLSILLGVLAGRAYVLDKGKVIISAVPRDIIESNILEKVFLGKA